MRNGLGFSGKAVAFAAHIRRPENLFADAVCCSNIPIVGGKAVSTSGPQTYGDIFSFESASARVLGDYADILRAAEFTYENHDENHLAARILAECTLEQFKIQTPPTDGPSRLFSIGRTQVRLQGFFDPSKAASFQLEWSLEDVTVDGHPLKVRKSPEELSEPQEETRLPPGETAVGHVVSALEWERSPAVDCAIWGNSLKIAGLGTVYFGEVLVETGSWHITLGRFALGSAYGGECAICDMAVGAKNLAPKFKICATGHLNDVNASQCKICGRSL